MARTGRAAATSNPTPWADPALTVPARGSALPPPRSPAEPPPSDMLPSLWQVQGDRVKREPKSHGVPHLPGGIKKPPARIPRPSSPPHHNPWPRQTGAAWEPGKSERSHLQGYANFCSNLGQVKSQSRRSHRARTPREVAEDRTVPETCNRAARRRGENTGREGRGHPNVRAGHSAAWSVCRSVVVRSQNTRAGTHGLTPWAPSVRLSLLLCLPPRTGTCHQG